MLLETAFVCLAMNVYHEARNQSFIGQVAVAQVVMNRVHDTRFPDDVCEVVTKDRHTHGSLTFLSGIGVTSHGTVTARVTSHVMQRHGSKHRW